MTNHSAAHCVILPKSALIQAAAVTGHRQQYKHLYHLQKSRILEPISRTISLIYTRNKRGPKIEPKGTPACIKVQSETAPGRTTLCFRLVK